MGATNADICLNLIGLCGNNSSMLNKFANATKRISPILDLMTQETASVQTSLANRNFLGLADTVDRLALLTSRLYSEYLSSQNQFSENPDLLNEALRVLTASQQANIEAQQALAEENRKRAEQGLGNPNPEEPQKPWYMKLEERIVLFSAVATPAFLFYISRDENFGEFKKRLIQGVALTSGLVSLRYYLQMKGDKDA